eukprot:CAMPEP_0174736604 /NCGR_PEP_ID=MMETSP1094-20130205/66961_1 /TAXON_ID=156173 /ORGANISM="Chrysochromulina brevifilum, Strain UTEX LB 985" /LENGTH=118 /DNA_ID=CAMNT_0015939733 /DNA_START=129 /DNA_END=485 /DNA_ORIENTATION=+
MYVTAQRYRHPLSPGHICVASGHLGVASGLRGWEDERGMPPAPHFFRMCVRSLSHLSDDSRGGLRPYSRGEEAAGIDLIGGATTLLLSISVPIRPALKGPASHVRDAACVEGSDGDPN